MWCWMKRTSPVYHWIIFLLTKDYMRLLSIQFWANENWRKTIDEWGCLEWIDDIDLADDFHFASKLSLSLSNRQNKIDIEKLKKSHLWIFICTDSENTGWRRCYRQIVVMPVLMPWSLKKIMGALEHRVLMIPSRLMSIVKILRRRTYGCWCRYFDAEESELALIKINQCLLVKEENPKL